MSNYPISKTKHTLASEGMQNFEPRIQPHPTSKGHWQWISFMLGDI